MYFKPFAAGASPAMLQFVEDERLRTPLLFDQLAEGTSDHIKKQLPTLSPLARSNAADLLQALKTRRTSLCDMFTRSLDEQVQAELGPQPPVQQDQPPARPALRAASLALVDEDEVAIDVELAHAIEQIKSVAEYELRELQTYTAALVGDMDVTGDHNPFRAETFARALWAAAQGLSMSRGFQVQFMRYASGPLAQLLRLAYAASSSRLDMQGVEPAAYRTVILPSGARRSRSVETSYGPNLQQVREALSIVPPWLQVGGGASPSRDAFREAPPRAPAAATARPARALPSRPNLPPSPPSPPSPLGPLVPPVQNARIDAQSEALVGRLFDAIRADTRVPPDVLLLIMRLHSSALRLAAIEGDGLADEDHPLWRFINQLAYEAEMMPDPGDPERARLLRTAQTTIEQWTSEPAQSRSLCWWAGQQLDTYLGQRLARRCTAAASQIGALQKLEDRLMAGQPAPSTMNGALDLQQLDTVPADLLPDHSDAPADATHRWLDKLQPGVWLRLFLQGRWVHAQVLWPGERREIWLLGDGASDTTWAVRRRALATLHNAKLLKDLRRRSLVRRAAAQVHAAVRHAA